MVQRSEGAGAEGRILTVSMSNFERALISGLSVRSLVLVGTVRGLVVEGRLVWLRYSSPSLFTLIGCHGR